MNARIPLACVAMAVVALGLCREAGAVDPNRSLDEYARAVWKPGDNGLDGQPAAVAQTNDGYLWVGTAAGLFRFDGVRFHAWGQNEPDRPFDGLVGDLYKSPDGSLWVSTLYKGLTWLKDQRVETIGHYFSAMGITEDRAGVIWYINYDVSKRELCSLRRNSVPQCQPTQHKCVVLASLGGVMWCGADTGLLRFDHGKQLFMPIAGMASEVGQTGVAALIPDDHGGLYVGLDRNGPGLGLEQLRGDTLAPVRVGHLDGSQLMVSALFKDREGALWVGTYAGIYRIYKGRVDHLPLQDRDAPAEDITEDREGSIWVATVRGLERFSDKAVVDVNFDSTQRLGIGDVDGVTASRDGTLWLGGGDTLMALRPGSRIFTVPVRLPPNSEVTSILEDHNGTMWIGINDSLYSLDAHKLTPLTSGTGKPLGMILSLAEDNAYNLWAVTHGSTRQILRIDERSRRIAQVTTLPPASRVTADPAGGVYVAALNGDLVHVASDGERRVYPHLDNRSARISRLLVTKEGTVYASTPFGLQTLNNDRLRTVDTHNGLPCDRVYDTVVDHSGDIWLYMQCGLVRIPKAEMSQWRKNPSALLVTQVFDAEDGAKTSDADFNGSAVTRDGTLWFANGGVQSVDPHSALFRSGPAAPPVHIEELAADGKQYSVHGPINLPPLTRDIQIDYAGLSFIAPDKVRFRYKLEGFDEDWKSVGARRQAFYNTLPPGRYRFRVIASIKGGAWNTVGDGLNIYLAPTFYQSLWFRLLCGAFAALLLWLIVQLRLRQLVAQVRARQSAQYAERERIARTLHDTLLQSVQGLIWSFSAVAKHVHGDPVRRDLQDLLDRSDKVLAEARNSILDLREPGNRSLALAEEISALGKEAVGTSGILVTVLTNGKPYTLDPDTYESTVLIVREALLNAVRHAKARSLEVQIDYLERGLRISVRDDGRGIDQETLQHGRSGHWGMLGMRERSKAFHGKLRILSRAGAGTEVELVVPRGQASR